MALFITLYLELYIVINVFCDVYGKTTECMMTLLVNKNILEILIVNGDVELNPGPSRICRKCEKCVSN